MPGMVLNGMIALKSNVFWPRVHFTIKFIRSCVLYWMHNAQSSPRKINIQLQIRLLWNFLFKMIGWKKFLRKSATVVSWGEFKWKCCYVEPLRLNIPNLLLFFVCHTTTGLKIRHPKMVRIISSDHLKSWPFGGIFLVKITFYFISGDFRAKNFMTPKLFLRTRIFQSPRC